VPELEFEAATYGGQNVGPAWPMPEWAFKRNATDWKSAWQVVLSFQVLGSEDASVYRYAGTPTLNRGV
jgi:hypothetical protein